MLMKTNRFFITALLSALSMTVAAQSMRLSQGAVTYVHSSANTGDMTFSGNVLNVEGKQYLLDNGTTLEVSAQGVDDNTVAVSYKGTTASVVVAGNIARYMTVAAKGADVAIVAAPELQKQVTYILSGTSADGSFYMDGEFAAMVKLDNLTLTNPDSAAINIQDGKLITIDITGQSTLADGANGLHNA